MLDMLEEDPLGQLEKRIGYCFKNRELLRWALTHSSYVNEHKINKGQDYERLEFLGDAVLEMISSAYLYKEYPTMQEGEMTRKRASIVCGGALAICAKEIGLGEILFLGRGEETTGGREKENIIADCMEALVGAIFLDSGYDAASDFVGRTVLADLEHKELFFDSKTLLQEYAQRESGSNLNYVLVDAQGPDHDREYVMEVRLNGKTLGRGGGKTKKAAAQRAAYEALLALRVQE